MFNALDKEVRCDECERTISVKAWGLRSAKKEVEAQEWLYSGVGEFLCPKCRKKS